MNRLFYNAGLAVGTLLCGCGAGFQWGAGVGMLVAGGLVIALTLFGAFLTREA